MAITADEQWFTPNSGVTKVANIYLPLPIVKDLQSNPPHADYTIF
jgi:hypothetical protein